MHALPELHVFSQTLAAVFQVDTQQRLISQLLLDLSQAALRLKAEQQEEYGDVGGTERGAEAALTS